MQNVQLPKCTKKREFDMNKIHLFDDENTKYEIIIERKAYQNIGLGILNSTQKLQCHERAIRMMLSRH